MRAVPTTRDPEHPALNLSSMGDVLIVLCGRGTGVWTANASLTHMQSADRLAVCCLANPEDAQYCHCLSTLESPVLTLWAIGALLVYVFTGWGGT